MAPSCEICGHYAEGSDGGCTCEELEEHAKSFLAPEGGHEGMDCESSQSLSRADKNGGKVGRAYADRE